MEGYHSGTSCLLGHPIGRSFGVCRGPNNGPHKMVGWLRSNPQAYRAVRRDFETKVHMSICDPVVNMMRTHHRVQVAVHARNKTMSGFFGGHNVRVGTLQSINPMR